MEIKGSFAKSYDKFVKRPTLLPEGLNELIRSLKAQKFLEFACGTGTVAVGLSLQGFKVTGVDYSVDMLKQAKIKAKEHKVAVKLVKGDITKINLKEKFDLLLCLGNTIPQFTNMSILKAFLKNCKNHLVPGGYIIFQQLNYDRILKQKPATFAVETSGSLVRLKQYRYGRGYIDFVVTIIDGNKIPPQISSSEIKLKPWTKPELTKIMTGEGFKDISVYGDYNRSGFDLNAKDLIIVGQV